MAATLLNKVYKCHIIFSTDYKLATIISMFHTFWNCVTCVLYMLEIVSSPLPLSPAGLFADISFYLEVSRLNRASITKAITQKLFPVDNLMSICFYFTQTEL